MTPEPALWNWRSRGTSKKRRKKGSSNRGLRCPDFSLMVPRVAMFTTEGETRLTIGASEGMGAAAAACTVAVSAAGAMMAAAKRVIDASLRRMFTRVLPFDSFFGAQNEAGRCRPAFLSRTLPRSYTQDGSGRAPLGGFHRDAMRLHLRHFRNGDFQHAVGELRLDAQRVGRFRQAEAALEFALDALHAAISLARLTPAVLALPANGQHALIGGDFHCLRVHSGQIHLQCKLVRFFVDVHRRQPSAGIRGGRQRRAE